MTYRGKYRIKHISKYNGDYTNVVYRSLWERQVMRWCESNPNIEWWNSETLVVPYRCATDKRMHRYFIDFQIKFKDGLIYCIEVKPKAQTKRPVGKKGKPKRRLIEEVRTYAKNISKWTAAERFCNDNQMVFEVWTEDTLKKLGIKLILNKKKTNK